MTRVQALIASTAIAAYALGVPPRAHAAADVQSAQVTEVIVTAQKREQKVQDVPLAVTAFNAQTLKSASVTNLTDLNGKIPNVTLEAVATFPNASAFSIRGLAFGDVESTFEPTVGVEVNGVYLARNVGATQDFFDIDSIEVLRGPQGTLDGANTIGGLVAINTKKPTGGFGGEVEVTAGDRGRVEVRAAVNAPIVKDVLAVRLSVLDLNYDGYLHNIYNDGTMGNINSLSERLTLAYTPNAAFDATLVLDHDTDRDGGFPNINGTPAVGSIAPAPDFLLAILGAPRDPHQKPYDVNSSTPQHYNFSTTGASATMNWRTALGTVTSVTGYREYDDDNTQEYGGAGFPFFYSNRTQNHDQLSQELRLASKGGGLLDYVVGVYYLRQHYDLQNAEGGSLFGGFGVVQYAHQDSNAYAGFGQLDFHLTDALTLTAGGRYSYEDKTFHNQPPGYSSGFDYAANWSDFSPKAAISYKFTPDIMGYVQYSRGYRSGGFNGRAGSQSAAGPYNAEHVDSYEIGLKNQFFDRRWIVNADVFLSKYANIQEGVQRLNATTHLDETVVANAGAATYMGVEVESHAILGGGFSLDASVGYLDAHFDSFTADLNGACSPGEDPYFCGSNDYRKVPLASAPRWSLSMTGNYRHRFSFAVFNANLSATYTSSQYTSLSPINTVADFSLRPANTILNTTVSLATPDEKYRIALWVKNLTDQHVLYDRFAVGPLSAPQSYSPPLTWGVSLSGKF
jgi:iron complex outermembrane receptor protein